MALVDQIAAGVLELVWLLLRAALRAFFSAVEIEGAEHVPPRGPLLVLPNHQNAFVDPLIVQLGLRRRLTLTAKNTLGASPLYGRLMRLARVVPFHRQKEWGRGADRRAHVATFAECRRRLIADAALCIFPEGISHEDPALRPFKVGPARIALDYVAVDGNPGGLLLCPVGVSYEHKARPRSRVWLRFGPPLDVGAWCRDHADASPRALSAELERRVRALIVERPSHKERLLFDFVARLGCARRAHGGDVPFSRLVQARGQAAEALAALHASDPPQAAALRRRARLLRRRLLRRRVRPEALFQSAAARRRVLAVTGLRLVLRAPLAAVGLVAYALPVLLVTLLTRRLATLPDLWAPSAVYLGATLAPPLLLLEVVGVAAVAAAVDVPSAGLAVAVVVAGLAAVVGGGRAALAFIDDARAVAAAVAAGRGLRGAADVEAEAIAVVDAFFAKGHA